MGDKDEPDGFSWCFMGSQHSLIEVNWVQISSSPPLPPETLAKIIQLLSRPFPTYLMWNPTNVGSTSLPSFVMPPDYKQVQF